MSIIPKELGFPSEILPQLKVSNGSGYVHPVKQMLVDYGKCKLLTADEEIALAKRIELGDKEAKETMIMSNLRLVISIAKKHSMMMELTDLVQEGIFGLIKAVEGFDWRRGCKFSTYAVWWIHQAIDRAIDDQGKTIRVPVHGKEKINKIHCAEIKLTQELGRPPTIDEIAEETGLSCLDTKRYLSKDRGVLSLDDPINPAEKDSITLGNTIEDINSPDPFEIFTKGELSEGNNPSKSELRKIMEEILSEFNSRERKIIECRYGFTDDGIPLTLEQVGQKFGVTRERIRQIQAKAIQKMQRNWKIKEILNDYYTNQ